MTTTTAATTITTTANTITGAYVSSHWPFHFFLFAIYIYLFYFSWGSQTLHFWLWVQMIKIYMQHIDSYVTLEWPTVAPTISYKHSTQLNRATNLMAFVTWKKKNNAHIENILYITYIRYSKRELTWKRSVVDLSDRRRINESKIVSPRYIKIFDIQNDKILLWPQMIGIFS